MVDEGQQCLRPGHVDVAHALQAQRQVRTVAAAQGGEDPVDGEERQRPLDAVGIGVAADDLGSAPACGYGVHDECQEDAGGDRHGQIDEDGDDHRHEHHGDVAARGDVRLAQALPVEHADRGQDQDARQNGEGDVLHDGPEADHEGEKDDAVRGRRQGGAAAASDVDHGPDGRTGAGEAAEETAGGVADALADQLLVALVPSAGDVVHDDRGQQRVDGAEQRDAERGQQEGEDQGAAEVGDGERGYGLRDLAYVVDRGVERDRSDVYVPQERLREPQEQGHEHERDQAGRDRLDHARRQEHQHNRS